MSAHKNIDRICIVIVVLTLVVSLLFCNGSLLGIGTTARAAGYENRLFDKSRVHTLDIVIDDWDAFLETCENEVYSPCSLVIDGEAFRNVGIRGKGNTSLSSVKNMDSSRYSFKIEFDQYETGKSYYGLDKLCLNNIIQDNTYMKDYLAYTLMEDFGVDSPLCSYVYITVNDEDWGLYLAVEAIEEAFLTRNYGAQYGDLYKPDSMSFGGGRGNGMDFSMSDFMNENSDSSDTEKTSDSTEKSQKSGRPDFGNGNMPSFDGEMPEGFDPSQMGGNMPSFDGEMPENFDPSQMMGGGFGMGSADVKLQYIDDDPDSYSNIFNNAKTAVNTADQNRLIRSLKALSEQTDLASTVDTEEVIRYFVVHNFLCNGDSYTGQMIHNYYLYEEDGQLSMIPWDYNLAYGSFMGGQGTSSVNSPIDTPISGDMSDRPMIAWIFDNAEYTAQYHTLFSEFLDSCDFGALVDETAAMIDSYVQKDPTAFCTYEEFQKGVTAIRTFCELREESVRGQLDGSIPSTTDGQSADSSALIDASSLTISDMGTMNNGGGGFGGGFGGFGGKGGSSDASAQHTSAMQPSGDFKGEPSEGFDGNMPDFDGEMPDFGGEMPEGFDPSKMGGKPEQDTEPSTEQSTETDETAPNGMQNPGPDMGSLAPMGGGMGQQGSPLSLIMLGISSVVLLIGIMFTLLFKR